MTTKITTIYQTNHCFIYRSVTCTIDSIVRCHQRQYVIYTSLLSYNKYSPTFLGRWGRCMFNVHFSKSGEKNEKILSIQSIQAGLHETSAMLKILITWSVLIKMEKLYRVHLALNGNRTHNLKPYILSHGWNSGSGLEFRPKT